MAMKTLLVLLVLVCCSMAVPQVPRTFHAKMTTQIWNGSTIQFLSPQGYMAQVYNGNRSVMCYNYTDTQSNQLQTECFLSTMSSSHLIYTYYIKSADGTVLWCNHSDMGEVDFTGFFDWVKYTRPMGKCNDTCSQELEKWQYDITDNSSQSIGVTDSNPDTPGFYKIMDNMNTTQEQQSIFCFDEFLSEVPPVDFFVIPDNCQSAQPQARLRGPDETKYKMAHYMQHKMKLKYHAHYRL